jgi:hypothetical protein
MALKEDASLGHPSTSYSTGILLTVLSTTAELAEDGVCIGSEWHSITYKKLKVLCPIQMHDIEPL